MRARTLATSAAAWLGLTGVLAAGALVAVGAAHTASLLPESIRPAPAWLQGAFAPIDRNKAHVDHLSTDR